MNHPLLQKASIVLTPTAYGADTLNSIKPAIPFGDELVVNGNYRDGLTGWSTQIPSGQSVSVTNNQLRINYDSSATQGSTGVNQTILTANKPVRIIVDIASITGTIRIQAGGQVQDISSTGVHTFEKTPTSAILFIVRSSNSSSVDVTINSISVKEKTDADFEFTRGSTGTRVGESGLIETIASGKPRINFTSGAGALLLEPQITNHYLKSEAFDNFSGTINLNNATSPTGATNAAKLTKTSASDQFLNLSWSGTTISTSTAYTMSLFVKHNGDDIDVRYEYNNSSDWGVTWTALFLVRASGTTASTVTNCTSKVEDFGNGWYRISCTFTTAGSVSATSPANLVRITGGDTETILVFGAQMEKYLAPTSYIPSLGTAVTRSQDVCGNAGSSDLINSTEGTLYAEIDVQAISGGTFLSLSAGNSSNRVIFGFISSSGKFFITGSGSTSSSTFSITTGQFNKIALTYKANERKVFVNGSSAFSSTSSFSLPTGLSELSFDSNGTGSQDFEGSVKTVAVFKEALTDAELTTLTS
jgi:hypothetical protein|tara:strand:+ start:927 stop:2519 length:1593 start_codon:yes stop_codon:yes gene_type:complete